MRNGGRIYVLAEGRLVNLARAPKYPASVMDMSFANQALSAAYLVERGRRLENKVYTVPERIDGNIAKMKLATLGITIDTLTRKSKKIYLSSWEMGIRER